MLHAANEDEVDDVLVVNEEHGDDHIDNNKYKPVTSTHVPPRVAQGPPLSMTQSNANDLRSAITSNVSHVSPASG